MPTTVQVVRAAPIGLTVVQVKRVGSSVQVIRPPAPAPKVLVQRTGPPGKPGDFTQLIDDTTTPGPANRSRSAQWLDNHSKGAVDVRQYGIFPDGTDILAKWNTMMAALSSGQTVVFPYLPQYKDGNNNVVYSTSGLLAITKEIKVTTNDFGWFYTILRAMPGFTDSHLLANFTVADYGGTQTRYAPNTTAGNVHHVSVKGITLDRNGIPNLSCLTLVHPHEGSEVQIVTRDTAGTVNWGGRAMSIFSNSDSGGMIAGALTFDVIAYGSGYDHHYFIDGTNNGQSPAANANWALDFVLRGTTSPVQSGGVLGAFPCYTSSPIHVKAAQNVRVAMHQEATPPNVDPSTTGNTWTATTYYPLGARIIAYGTDLNPYIYEATVGGTTGASAPAFPTAGAATVTDGSATWARRQAYLPTGLTVWPGAGATTQLGQSIIKNGAHQVVTTAGTTGTSEPASWPSAPGSTTTDGTTVWTTLPLDTDTAMIRAIDVSALTIDKHYFSPGSMPTNRPLVKASTTGNGLANLTYSKPVLSDITIQTGQNAPNMGGPMGNIIEWLPNGGAAEKWAFDKTLFNPLRIHAFGVGEITWQDMTGKMRRIPTVLNDPDNYYPVGLPTLTAQANGSTARQVLKSNIDSLRIASVNQTLAMTSGQVQLIPLADKAWLVPGDVITGFMLRSGTTALAGGTHCWGALLDPNLVPLAFTPDDTAPVWAATNTREFVLTAPVTITKPGLYSVAACVVATTPPTVQGITGASPAPLVSFNTTASTYTTPASFGTVGQQFTGAKSQHALLQVWLF